MTKTIVIGIGNPYLRDDSVGVVVARDLRERLGSDSDVRVEELYVGGLKVMETMAGYDRAVLVDAMSTGEMAAGGIRRMDADEIGSAHHIWCLHDTSLAMAMEFGRRTGVKLPDDVVVWGIEAERMDTFGEDLSPAVEASARELASRIAGDIRGQGSVAETPAGAGR